LQYPLIVDLLQKAKAAGIRMIARILIAERGAVMTDGGAQSYLAGRHAATQRSSTTLAGQGRAGGGWMAGGGLGISG
jgi:hypothetical protein